MDKDAKVFIAGVNNLIGLGLKDYLEKKGFTKVLSEETDKVNLLRQEQVESLFKEIRPEYVFLAHYKSGGITANIKYPAEFIYENLQVQNNIINASYKSKVKRLAYFASSCVYPKACPQPMKEEYLLTGALEETSEAYALAKLAGIKMCQAYNRQYGTDFISIIPATAFGPQDHLDSETSHVLGSLIKRFHEAKVNKQEAVTVLGTGRPQREFIYIDDLVEAAVILAQDSNAPGIINVGSAQDISIGELAKLVGKIIGFKGRILFNNAKIDGVSEKLLDSSRTSSLGWRPRFSLKEGIKLTYNWYKTPRA